MEMEKIKNLLTEYLTRTTEEVRAKAAGCQIVTIDSDGIYKDYEFLPGRQHGKVDLLIASSTSELRDELINYYVKKYDEKYSFSRV